MPFSQVAIVDARLVALTDVVINDGLIRVDFHPPAPRVMHNGVRWMARRSGGGPTGPAGVRDRGPSPPVSAPLM
ncbi:MAG: hypothetical protein OXG72_02525 [Acidobacteria bacterium]|nr:hypothetical protein [Acidobacteriota bacterium]